MKKPAKKAAPKPKKAVVKTIKPKGKVTTASEEHPKDPPIHS